VAFYLIRDTTNVDSRVETEYSLLAYIVNNEHMQLLSVFSAYYSTEVQLNSFFY